MLKENWRDVLQYAWSMRLIALSALLTGIEFVLPIFMENPPIGRGWFAALAFAVSIAAGVARLFKQRNVAG